MFEKTILAQNIQYLSEKTGKKIGDLEKSAGVSIGYTSRLLKNDEKNTFSLMNLAMEASKEFCVPVDLMLTKKVADVHPNELYLMDFFNKLRNDTLAGIISWTVETESMITKEYERFNHPAFAIHYNNPYNPDDCICYYKSPFNSDNHINDSSVRTLILGKQLYIVEIKQGFKDEKKGFEVYFAEYSGNIEPIICVLSGNYIYERIKDLFLLAMESRNQIMLSYSIRNTIDGYMGKLQEATEFDEQPF